MTEIDELKAHIAELEKVLSALLEMSAACASDSEVIENVRRRAVARALIDGFVAMSIAKCSKSDTEALPGNSNFRTPEWVHP
jgi:hypothetical protein